MTNKNTNNLTTETRNQLVLKGVWNLKKCGELQQLLLKQPFVKHHFTVDLTEVIELDLTSLQLLIAFKIDRNKDKQLVKIKPPKNEDLQTLLRRTGFFQTLNLKEDDSK